MNYTDGVYAERHRIRKALEELELQSHKTRTPIFQDTIFEYLKELLYEPHPPTRFRDRSNGE